MNIEKEREAFEAEYAGAFRFASGKPGKFDLDANGDYEDVQVLVGWRMWRVRAALQSQDREDSARLNWLESCEEAHGFCHTGYGEYRYYAHQTKGLPSVREAIDHARRVEGEG